MKFSLRLNNDLPVKDYLKIAQTAEQVGFDQFWVSNDLFLRSATVILTAVAGVTKTIELGTCILNPYTINPAEIAMFAATLDEYCGGRFNLGLSSGANDFLQWVDIHPEKPRTAVVETTHAINNLLNGDKATHTGHFINWTEEAYLRFQSQRRVPIYIGAMSPNMLRSIGAVADGGLPLLFPPEHYKNIMPYIEEGAQQANRNLEDVDVAACVWCSVGDNYEQAIEPLKEKLAYYGHAMSDLILEQVNLTRDDFKEIERLAMQENDIESAKKLITDEMLQMGIAGTSKDLIQRLEILTNFGVNHISLGPPIGPDIVSAIELIGQEVVPYFRN